MREPTKTIAVLVANPALSSILVATLADCPRLRVRPFASEAALATYLRVVPADLVVIDLDSLEVPIGQLLTALREDAALAALPQVIALAGALPSDARESCTRLGIDEMMMKPMSPQYLVERVLARVAPSQVSATRAPSPRTADWSSFGANVVPLFRPAPTP